MNLYELLNKIGIKYCNDLAKIKAGTNGPYNHNETIYRNYAHWIIFFSRLYKMSNNLMFKDSAEKLGLHLLKPTARPNSLTFHCRTVRGKDSCNGLIGQAWIIEGLAELYNLCKKEEYISVAKEVFHLHDFDYELGLWHTLDIDGTKKEIDGAFNHQLWFAYAGSLFLNKEDKGFEQLIIFLNKLESNLTIINDGLIYHPIERIIKRTREREKVSFLDGIKKALRKTYYQKSLTVFFDSNKSKLEKWRLSQKYKSNGYHAFNMHAFVRLEKNIPNHIFWSKPVYKLMIRKLFDEDFLLSNLTNKYSYPYNPTGFEISNVIFYKKNIDDKKTIGLISKFLNIQFGTYFHFENLEFSKNNFDKHTLTARLYEVMSLSKNIVSKIEIKY